MNPPEIIHPQRPAELPTRNPFCPFSLQLVVLLRCWPIIHCTMLEGSTPETSQRLLYLLRYIEDKIGAEHVEPPFVGHCQTVQAGTSTTSISNRTWWKALRPLRKDERSGRQCR